MTPEMPDVDLLVTDALRAGLPGVAVRVLVPQDWADALPLVVARQVSGGSSDPRGIALVTVDVQAFAATRREASALARSARIALVSACNSRFANTEGYLGAFRDIGGLPTEIRGGDPADDPHTFFRFQGTYQCVVRPAK